MFNATKVNIQTKIVYCAHSSCLHTTFSLCSTARFPTDTSSITAVSPSSLWAAPEPSHCVLTLVLFGTCGSGSHPYPPSPGGVLMDLPCLEVLEALSPDMDCSWVSLTLWCRALLTLGPFSYLLCLFFCP